MFQRATVMSPRFGVAAGDGEGAELTAEARLGRPGAGVEESLRTLRRIRFGSELEVPLR